MKPAKRITDPDFRYVSSANTDLHKTFQRVKWEIEQERRAREQREAHEREPANDAEASA